MKCSYAACTHLARVTIDGWGFCRDHARAHEEEKIGANPPPQTTGTRPICGTMPGWHRHEEYGEKPCRRCNDAKGNAVRQKRKRDRRREQQAQQQDAA